jgi:hypothetical protein
MNAPCSEGSHVPTDVERASEILDDLWRNGDLSDEAGDALLKDKTATRQIGSGLGQLPSGEDLLLATILVDDSPSVGSNVPHIRHGHTMMFEVLRRQATDSEVMLLTRALNRGLISPFLEIANAAHLTAANYSEQLLLPYTPLYRQSITTLVTTMAKAREAQRSGVKARTFTLIITDGQDNPDMRNETDYISVSAVRAVVTDMTKLADNHIVAGMGVGELANWYKVFDEMGIHRDWIFDAGASVEELERAFKRISQRLALAASSVGGFEQLTAGNYPDVPRGSA